MKTWIIWFKDEYEQYSSFIKINASRVYLDETKKNSIVADGMEIEIGQTITMIKEEE